VSEERLLAALATIHDHLHANRVNEAHAACECALDGGDVSPPNITGSDASRLHAFIHEFNLLAKRHGIPAATFIPVPSKTDPRKVSLQIGGSVTACQILEEMLGKKSTYKGDHGEWRNAPAEKAP
jgi:hypothetical protein